MRAHPPCIFLITVFYCSIQPGNAQNAVEEYRLTKKTTTGTSGLSNVFNTNPLINSNTSINRSYNMTMKEYNERGNLIKMAEGFIPTKPVFTITINPDPIIPAALAPDLFTGLLLTAAPFSGVVQHHNAPSIISKKDDKGLAVYQDSLHTKSLVPDTIIRLARKEKGSVIETYNYQGQVLYFIPTTYTQRAKLRADKVKVFDENYYDTSGKVVAVFKRAAESMFMRAQHWEPASFSPSRLIRTGIAWKNTDK